MSSSEELPVPPAGSNPRRAVALDRRSFLTYLAGGSALAVAGTMGLGALGGPKRLASAGAAATSASSSAPAPSPTPSVPGGDPTSYQVDITMSPATLDALVDGDYFLYGFKAVQGGGDGRPLVWFALSDYSTSTSVQWQEQYQAYTSRQTGIPKGRIVASFSTDIALGETLQVKAGGDGTVVQKGTSGAISILNGATDEFTCGIAQTLADGSSSPMCAFPLYGEQQDVIIPIEKVLLMFSTEPVDTGTVIEQAYSAGVLVDLTGSATRKVAFDINKGWSWGGGTWATQVKADADLVPILVEK